MFSSWNILYFHFPIIENLALSLHSGQMAQKSASSQGPDHFYKILEFLIQKKTDSPLMINWPHHENTCLRCSEASRSLDILGWATIGIILNKISHRNRMRGCTCWYVSLLFAYGINRVSHFVTQISRIMRKPVYSIYGQRRRRSACASAQSDQHLCCSLIRQSHDNTCTCYSHSFKTLASLCSRADRFESYLVANPEGRFSRDVAQMINGLVQCARTEESTLQKRVKMTS